MTTNQSFWREIKKSEDLTSTWVFLKRSYKVLQLDKHLDEKAEASRGKSSDDSSAHGDCEEDE